MWRTSHRAHALLSTGLLVFCATLAPAGRARADAEEAAIVVVVESPAQRIAPALVRRALAERLGVPVVSLFDARARSSRGVLSILVDETGRRATVRFQPRGGSDHSAQVFVAAGRVRRTEWLVEAAASVIDASESWANATVLDTEILDPWGTERPSRYLASADPRLLPPEVLDPFGDGVPRSEVLDPWASPSDAPTRARGPASRLSRPIPGRPVRPAR